MDKRGQALVSFILLLPFFLLVFAFIIDGGLAYNKRNEVFNILKNSLDNNYDMEEMLKNNKIKYKYLEIKEENNQKCVIIDTSSKSIFGTIIGKEEYEIRIKECRG